MSLNTLIENVYITDTNVNIMIIEKKYKNKNYAN